MPRWRADIVRILRDAEWLTPERVRAYLLILAIVPALVSIAWIAMAAVHGGIDLSGVPVAPDFAPYWTASKLALAGRPGAAYDPITHYAAERALFGGASLGGPTPFLYPPIFLLLCLPLALLPYAAALTVWLGLTTLAYWRSVRAIWPGRGLAWPLLVFPGLLMNLLNGQNGLLSAALFAAATLKLDRRPMLAGACFGCLAYKPQLGLVIPFALLLYREWIALLAASATVIFLLAATLLAFDPSVWSSFYAASKLARTLLNDGATGPARMASVFAAAQLWAAPPALAYAAQAMSGIGALTALAMVPRPLRLLSRGAAICAAVPLVSPYLFDYDLAILAVPMAWLVREAETGGGFRPWEKSVLLAAFVLPLIARPVALHLSVPVAPFVAASLLALVLRRASARADQPGHRRGGSAVGEGGQERLRPQPQM